MHAQSNDAAGRLIAILAALLCLLGVAAPALAQPGQPFVSYGSVTSNGSLAPAGLLVAAWCGVNSPPGSAGAQCDAASTGLTTAQGNYRVDVACTGRTAGETIVFKLTVGLDTFTANQTGAFACGALPVNINLTIGPTPVTIGSFTAGSRAGKTTLRWQTESETDLLGFNLYRGSAAATMTAGTAAKLNSRLIAARATTPGQGAEYSFLDASGAATAYYWLEEVTIAGAGEIIGPVAPASWSPPTCTNPDECPPADASDR